MLNGGIATLEECAQHLGILDGVMLGRAAYKTPLILSDVDQRLFGSNEAVSAPPLILRRMRPYVAEELGRGTPLPAITRHMTGLLNGKACARRFRRLLTEESVKAGAGLEVIDAAIALAQASEDSQGGAMAA